MIWWQKSILVFMIAAGLFFMDKAMFFDSSLGAVNRFLISPIVKTTFFLGSESGFLFKNIFGLRGLIRENMFLKNQRDFFRGGYFNLLELKEENELLRQALNTSKSKSKNISLANILAFDPFQAGDALTLDRGAAQGVAAGNEVILPGNILVGRVKEVGEKESRVVLINSPQSRVTSVTEDGQAKGVVTGSASGALNLDLVLKDSELRPGQILLTSGLDGFFERGLLIGEVDKIIDDDSAPFKRALVRPFFNNRDLKQVFIIID
ncbi:MAG: rod shape-determining protein MreC [Parcubacteria group bacterium]|nr:rod shape-determining protein MreC [Parcubacteria group bacterium]